MRTPQPLLTLVSVVFEAEFSLLQLQARSVAVYVPPELVAEILVIDNSARGIPAEIEQQLRKNYGALAERVRILRPGDISPVPGAVGWRSQQVLKLAVAELITSDRYLVLDAKNHFVRPLHRDVIESPDGRPRVTAYSYETHRLRPDLEHVLRYLGLDPAGFVPHFTATVTPFVLDTAEVRAMMADLAQKSGRTFGSEFVAQDLTEFFLYSGWIVAGGRPLAEFFDLQDVAAPVVWPKAANRAGIEAAVTADAERQTPFFAVHRRALAQIDPAGITVLAEFWCERGLFDSVGAAETFVAEFQQAYRRELRRQQIRELPHKIRSAPRKLRRRALRRLGR